MRSYLPLLICLFVGFVLGNVVMHEVLAYSSGPLAPVTAILAGFAALMLLAYLGVMLTPAPAEDDDYEESEPEPEPTQTSFYSSRNHVSPYTRKVTPRSYYSEDDYYKGR